MTTTTIYTRDNCLQCDASKMFMSDNDKTFREVPLETHPEELARLKALGYMAAPIIETPTETWTGFRPEKILALP